MSVDALVDEVRRRRKADEELHLTAIAVLADSELVRFGDDQIALAMAGWEAIRAEGATETFPTVSPASLGQIRSGVTLTDDMFRTLPEDDKANLVCIGFLGIVGERLASEPPSSTPEGPVDATQPSSRRSRKRAPTEAKSAAAKPRRRPAEG
jgi:cell division septation protein DedD